MKLSKCAGRPRQFDPEKALDEALLLFWRKGYEGTTLSDLTEAMGINRPSLYAAFGSKEELFQRVFERYARRQNELADHARELPAVRDAVEAFLKIAAEKLADPDHPGCLSVVAALACGDDCATVREALASSRDAAFESWIGRLERAKAEGDLPESADPKALARFIATISTGMSVQARSGATREDLYDVVKVAMRAWPDGDL